MTSMNEKSYEGLTYKGMALHIANAIALHRRRVGTKNDCKLVVAHLIRTYQSRLIGDGQLPVRYTEAARSAELAGDPIELEHAVPVGCLMNVLFHHLPVDDIMSAGEEVSRLVCENSILAYVTPEEHLRLNQMKLSSSMPAGFDFFPWKDVWARYRVAEIPLEPIVEI
jgi:hypothetical protein